MQTVPNLEARPVVSKARRISRRLVVSAGVLLCLLLVEGIVLAFKWPFTQSDFVRDLKHFSSSEVHVARFQQSYFPHPGYIAEGVIFSRRSGGHWIEMAAARRIECVGSWIALFTFTHRIKSLDIGGLHVSIPTPVPPAMPFYPSLKEETTVSTLRANGAVLDIAPRGPDDQALRIDFRKLVLGEIKKGKSISLETMLHLSGPPGELAVKGNFGPFVTGQLGAAPLSGSYDLRQVDLGRTKAISGDLASQGSFRGSLGRCEVSGKVRIRDFAIKKVRHSVQLEGEFDSDVDGLHGDVSIRSTKVRFLGSELQAKGDIRSERGEDGKTESLGVTSEHARIEDLLRLFAKSDPPALSGPINFHANVVLPPGPQEFLRKVRLDGDFEIREAEFPHPETQRKVDKLSERARGKKVKDNEPLQENILSSLNARVNLRNGTANLAQASFNTQGVSASGGGTYDLLTDEINLHGKVAIQASLSKAAGGFKSVLLKPLDPFFRKAHAGAVLPVHVMGTYPNPSFRVSLTSGKQSDSKGRH